MSKIRWSKEPYSSFRMATGSTEKAIKLFEFMKKNEHVRKQIIKEYYEI
jgi:hypothetical protein